MPYANPEGAKAWSATYHGPERRATKEGWFSGHSCPCGRPSVTVLAPDGPMPKSIWAWSQARREVFLVNCLTLCDVCGPRLLRERRLKTRTEVERAKVAPKPPAAPIKAARQSRSVNDEALPDPTPSVARRAAKSRGDGDFAAEMADLERRRVLRELREERRERLGYGNG